MDAAKGVKGQGWPLYAGPWSNDGVREPAAGGPDARGKTFWFLLGRLPKGTRRKGGTIRPSNTKAAYARQSLNPNSMGIAPLNPSYERVDAACKDKGLAVQGQMDSVIAAACDSKRQPGLPLSMPAFFLSDIAFAATSPKLDKDV